MHWGVGDFHVSESLRPFVGGTIEIRWKGNNVVTNVDGQPKSSCLSSGGRAGDAERSLRRSLTPVVRSRHVRCHNVSIDVLWYT